MSQEPSSISYDTLDSGPDSGAFRLLRLLGKSASDDETIECELFHSSLNEQPQYEAISYTWGDTNLRGSIRVDGKTVSVTKNLAWALSDIRGNEAKTIWVDALCIDQGNSGEKSHQVGQMGRIYASAALVSVWLGRSPNPEKNALATLIELWETISRRYNPTSHGVLVFSHDPEYWPKWHEIAMLCELPYWNRLWIVQEVGLAREVKVYLGRTSIDWRVFSHLRRDLLGIERSWPKPFRPLANIIVESMPSRLESHKSEHSLNFLVSVRGLLQQMYNANEEIFSSFVRLEDTWKATRYTVGNEKCYWCQEPHQQAEKTPSDMRIALGISRWLIEPTFILRLKALPLEFNLVRDDQRAKLVRQFDCLDEELASLAPMVTDTSTSAESSVGRHCRPSMDADLPLQLIRLRDYNSKVAIFSASLKTCQADLNRVPEYFWRKEALLSPIIRLQDLLESCERSVCQEPRDKVYGLLGLAGQTRDQPAIVDYEKSLFDLFEDVVFQKTFLEAPKIKNDSDLPRFSQLLQRSLNGPLGDENIAENGLSIEGTDEQRTAINVVGFIIGPILPLGNVMELVTSADDVDRERRALLRTYFYESSTDMSNANRITKILNLLRSIEPDILVSVFNREVRLSSKQQHPRLFSEASGLIGVAPSTIREDDLLCQFKGCDVACILRPDGDDYNIIGRALVAKKSDEADKRVSKSSPELFLYNVPEDSMLKEENQVSLSLDTALLQDLTCPVTHRKEYEFSTLDQDAESRKRSFASVFPIGEFNTRGRVSS